MRYELNGIHFYWIDYKPKKKMEMNGAPMNDSLFNWILECLQKSEVFYHKHHIAIWLKPMMFRLPKLIYTNQFQY